MKTVSQEEFKKMYGEVTLGNLANEAKNPGYLSRVKKSATKGFLDIGESAVRGAELMEQGKPVQGAVRSALGAAGGTVRTVFSPVTEALAPVFTAGIEKSGVLEKEGVQQKLASLDAWAKAHPDAAANLTNALELTAVKGATAVKNAAAPVVQRGVQATVDTTKAGVKATAGAAKTAGAVIADTAQGAARIPGNIATNVAERQATVQTIKQLPTKVAQTAARDGIDPLDIKDIYKVPAKVKPQARELAEGIKKYVARESDVEPIEIVGKPIVARMQHFEKLRGTIGEKLGAVADTLGNVTTKEAYPTVFEQLKRVRGLEGLKLGNVKVNIKGVGDVKIGTKKVGLDFSDTVLASELSKADRIAIQKAFIQATQPGSGKSKHLLRQELFEILGGKKRSLQQMTATQEKAYEAIRKGLSDVLETKNSSYKKLSSQYRKVVQPLADLRKAMRAIPDATEDVLDMSAGLLARRLTSTSISQGQVRAILAAFDKATKVKGNLLETTESMQKLYNLLGKYYDIAPTTGFQGQVKAAIDGAGGLSGAVIEGMKKFAGETPAVRQKALEKLLEEALR